MMISLPRQIARFFSTSTSSIPGLHVYPDFLPSNQKTELQQRAIGFHQEILKNSASSSLQRAKTFLSQYHNLASDEYFCHVKIGKVSGQHFGKYSEDGHKLTYFIGSNNLPEFLKDILLPKVLALPEVVALTHSRPLDWNFTFNTYAATKGEETLLAGFDFHKDIKSNGEVSMIYSIGAEVKFQIRHPGKSEEIQTISLLSNSLILLSQEARWDYEHRVVPIEVNENCPLMQDEAETIRRISLVLGFNRLT